MLEFHSIQSPVLISYSVVCQHLFAVQKQLSYSQIIGPKHQFVLFTPIRTVHSQSSLHFSHYCFIPTVSLFFCFWYCLCSCLSPLLKKHVQRCLPMWLGCSLSFSVLFFLQVSCAVRSYWKDLPAIKSSFMPGVADYFVGLKCHAVKIKF